MPLPCLPAAEPSSRKGIPLVGRTKKERRVTAQHQIDQTNAYRSRPRLSHSLSRDARFTRGTHEKKKRKEQTLSLNGSTKRPEKEKKTCLDAPSLQVKPKRDGNNKKECTADMIQTKTIDGSEHSKSKMRDMISAPINVYRCTPPHSACPALAEARPLNLDLSPRVGAFELPRRTTPGAPAARSILHLYRSRTHHCRGRRPSRR